MAVNLKKTNPKGWEKDQTPEEGPERIVYELHVKEFHGIKQVVSRGISWEIQSIYMQTYNVKWGWNSSNRFGLFKRTRGDTYSDHANV